MNFSFFLPKQPVFYSLFDRQTQSITKVSALLKELSQASGIPEIKSYAVRAKEIENEADAVIREMVRCLNHTFITPFDREDIFSLANELDDIVDDIENVIHNMYIYKVEPSEKLIADFARIILTDAEQLEKLILLLPKQEYSEEVRLLIEKIHNLEDLADDLFVETLSHLFSSGTDAVRIIKLKDIAENMEKITDRFQNACTTIENIFLKN